MNHFGFSKEEFKFLKSLKKPYDIQKYLNSISYNPEYVTSSPRFVMNRKSANCFEGALFAAAALRISGYKPLIVDLLAVNDDDHVITIFKDKEYFGAIAKSNTTLLRFREPVYITLRELVMSYFDFYFNTLGQKSLISYSNPVDLSKYDKFNWMTTEDDLGFIGDDLYKIHHHRIVSPLIRRKLNYADKDVVDACFSGAIPEGLFVPEKK